MVEAAANYWPEGWVKGAGFVRDRAVEPVPPVAPSRALREAGLEYVEQILACSPGQRKRYKAQVRLLAEVEVRGPAGVCRPFGGMIDAVSEGDLVSAIPTRRTAPKKRQIVQSQSDLRFLTEREFAITASAAGDDGDLLRVAAGTGLRYGEVTALWVSDVDLKHQTIRGLGG